jgi:hypothetical protein
MSELVGAMQTFDDFVIVTRPPEHRALTRRTGPLALTGPGLDAEGIPFMTKDEALERGRVIARNSRTALWDATATGRVVLVVSFRR